MPRWAAGLEALAQSQRWTRAEILDFQTRRLRAVVRHAGRQVPYYRRLFAEAGLKPEEIRSLQDLARIPISSRSDLQSLPDRDKVSNGIDPNKLILHCTSGTSGEPLRILRTLFEEYLLRVFRLKQQFLLGTRPTDRRFGLGHSGRRAPELERVPGGGARWLGFRKRWHLDQNLDPQQVVAELRRVCPDVLVGSASALSWMAGLVAPGDPGSARLRYVETTGETCTPEMRRQIEHNFNVPVHDLYSSHEFNLLAPECPKGGRYHVLEWNLILEVLDGDRPVEVGEQGEVVATGLHSYAMPLIRYRMNDLVIKGECPCPSCGAPVQTLRGILGRKIEVFHLPDGRRVHPYALVEALLVSAPWLRRYQIIQDRPDHVLVKLVPLEAPGADGPAVAARAVTGMLGGQATVDVELVSTIPAAPNGKYRPYLSLVSPRSEAPGGTFAGAV